MSGWRCSPPSGRRRVPSAWRSRICTSCWRSGASNSGPRSRVCGAVWRRDGELFAEVALAEPERRRAHRFGLHPALLDAALHAIGAEQLERERSRVGRRAEHEGISLPFSWSGARLYARGSSSLRACISADAQGVSLADAQGVSLALADETGAPVATVRSLAVRPLSAGQLEGARERERASLYRLDWVAAAVAESQDGDRSEIGRRWAVLGAGGGELAAALGGEAPVYGDLSELGEAIERDGAAPAAVLVGCGPTAVRDPVLQSVHPGGADRLERQDEEVVGAVHRMCAEALELAQAWLAQERLCVSRLVVLTRGAVAVRAGEGVPDLVAAPVWGLLRSAQSEHPGRLVLLDLDGEQASWRALPAALAVGEHPPRRGTRPADRDGAGGGPAAGRARGRGARPRGLREVDGREGRWSPRLGSRSGGWRPVVGDARGSSVWWRVPEAGAPLESGQVRVAVRAAGLNFRDVVIALGLCAAARRVGRDRRRGRGRGAGGRSRGSSGLAPGDRVMGLLFGAFGPVAVADRPDARADARGLVVYARPRRSPIAFLTAYYGLVDLAGLQRGERLLVHAATGGVGMAAVQLARHLGAEVFATASPAKWGVAEVAGLGRARSIASSRDPGFRERFLEATEGRGVDVVLNSLAREFVDASLELLPGGGRFIEMGKTDIRDPERDRRGASGRGLPGVRPGARPDRSASRRCCAELLGAVRARRARARCRSARGTCGARPRRSAS